MEKRIGNIGSNGDSWTSGNVRSNSSVRHDVTVVGGGIGGLVAAVEAREHGHAVTLHEARDRLGGRAWTTGGDHHANWGPHVVYSDGVLWRWLDERGLARPAGSFPKRAKALLREGGRARRLPRLAFARAVLKLRRAEAPVDESFSTWAERLVGAEAARVSSLMGVATFHHDPGRLSAAFVAERLRRATAFPPTVRYVPGGWGTVVERVAAYARSIGVHIATSSPVDALPGGGPVILAVPLKRASALLGEALTWTGARTALLDLAVEARRGDPFIVGDLDECGWVEAFSMADASLAPHGQHLVQGQIGMRPGEAAADAVARLERLVGTGFDGWGDRVVWRRQAAISGESGAVDLPGSTWRDRPAIDRGGDVYLVGDMVAAPGLLAEVSVDAARRAVAAISVASGSRSSASASSPSG